MTVTSFFGVQAFSTWCRIQLCMKHGGVQATFSVLEASEVKFPALEGFVLPTDIHGSRGTWLIQSMPKGQASQLSISWLGSKLHMKQKGVLQVYLTNFLSISDVLILNKFMHWRALSSMQVGWPPAVDLCLSQMEAIGKGWKEEKMQERLWIAANWDFGLQAAEQSQSTAGGLPCKDCILTNARTTIILLLKIWHKSKDFFRG